MRTGSHITTIYTPAVRDTRLSHTARGLLAELLSYPDNTLTPGQLITQGPEDEESITQALKELEAYGYVTPGDRISVTDAPGGFTTQTPQRTETEQPVVPAARREDSEPQEPDTHTWDTEDVPPDLDTQIDALCKFLADCVKANGAKRPKITYAWRNAARDLLTGDDPYVYAEVRGGIRWAQADHFWASRTITMAKLAKNFDTIIIQARKDHRNPHTPAGKEAQKDLMARRMEAMDALEAQVEARLGRPLTQTELASLNAQVESRIPE